MAGLGWGQAQQQQGWCCLAHLHFLAGQAQVGADALQKLDGCIWGRQKDEGREFGKAKSSRGARRVLRKTSPCASVRGGKY